MEIVSQDASNDIGGDIVTGMAQMGVIVNGRTAGIPGDVLRLKRDKGNF